MNAGNMSRILRWCVVFGIGLQVSTAVASEFGSLPPLQAKLPTQSSSCGGGRRPLTPHTTSTPNPPRLALFATSQSVLFSTRKSGSNLPNSVSTENSILSRHRFMPFSHAPPTPKSKLFMLTPENRELISTLASLSFWPDASYINEVVSWIIGLSFVFVGASLLASKPNADQQQQQLAFVTTGADAIANETNNNEDDVLLTPGTYADSNSAERLVTDTVVAKASEAFDSTDFENEPHLSPELEDVEAAFEVALLANAAHAMADAAEKENRQSKAAMLERERELEWIERHGEGESNLGMIVPSSNIRSKEKFQRSLLAAQLANKSNLRAKKQEAFQRSLLSSRIAYDVKSKENFVGQQLNEEATESSVSESVTDDFGIIDDLQFGVEIAQEAEYDGMNENVVGMDDDKAAHTSDESDESIVLGHDASENSQPSEGALQVETAIFVNNDNSQLVVQAKTISILDQSRKDSVQAVRKYIHQKAIEKTKQKMMLRNTDGGESAAVNNVESINADADDQSDEISGKELAPDSGSVMKLFNKRALIRRMPRRRRLLVVALGLVITRRLFLAYFGNALSMI